MTRKPENRAFTAAVLGLAVLAALLSSCGKGQMKPEDAGKELDRLVRQVGPRDGPPVQAGMAEAPIERSVAATLPDISRYPIVVDAEVADAVAVEIFCSTEKSGKGTDGCLTEIASAFNRAKVLLANGRTAQVRLRSIASGTAFEYIAYGRYRPDAFTPSNMLWIQMVKAAGVPVTSVSEKLVGNVPGVVMKEDVFKSLEKKYGTVDVRGIIDAVATGAIKMGYTNPFASSTGLNFLVTVLSTFAGGDQGKMLSPEVESAFETFQKGVPFVSLTTIQMRDSVEKGGSLDAFILEYQTFVNTQALSKGYRFIPFGFRHDNPLYAIGAPGKEKTEALRLFADYVRGPASLPVVKRYGFDPDLSYQALAAVPPGDLLTRAQSLWKEKKDVGRPVVAVFLSDVSGSMDGERIKKLKDALIQGSAFIDPRNHIGLVSFATTVTRILPVEKFGGEQKTKFLAAVKSLSASGNTAMYDGIVVSLQIIRDALAGVPDAKPMLFVLTDGETNRGLEYDSISKVLQGTGVPIYTISYGEDVSQLKALSSLNEAASMKADPSDIAYQIGSLLNAEM